MTEQLNCTELNFYPVCSMHSFLSAHIEHLLNLQWRYINERPHPRAVKTVCFVLGCWTTLGRRVPHDRWLLKDDMNGNREFSKDGDTQNYTLNGPS